MNQSIVWTDEIDARVDRMRAQGYSWPRIGELLGTSGDACRRRTGRRKAGLKRQPDAWTAKDDAVYLQLYNRVPHISINKIAVMMGKSRHSCQRARHRLGLELRIGPNHLARISNKRKLRCDGKPFAAKIAEANAKAAAQSMDAACIVGFDNGGLPFEKITSKSCRFIKGEPKAKHTFCEKQALPGKSWCEFHYGIVFQGNRK